MQRGRYVELLKGQALHETIRKHFEPIRLHTQHLQLVIIMQRVKPLASLP